jgi:hypothetical protein
VLAVTQTAAIHQSTATSNLRHLGIDHTKQAILASRQAGTTTRHVYRTGGGTDIDALTQLADSAIKTLMVRQTRSTDRLLWGTPPAIRQRWYEVAKGLSDALVRKELVIEVLAIVAQNDLRYHYVRTGRPHMVLRTEAR